MKLTTILLLVFCLQVAARTEGQTVTLSLKNAPMKEVFREIQKQTKLNILINDKALAKAGKVTLEVRNMPVAEVLTLCFKNEPLSYTIVDGTIVVKTLPATLSAIKALPPIDIHGRITNENGEPVEGASILVKGTGKGATSNADGYFELKGVDENAVLSISGVNIETSEVTVNGKTNLTISVRNAIRAIDAVVVNKGYYSTSQRLNTGNVSRVTSKDIEKLPIANPLQAMQGRMAGVYIQQNTGIPGGGFEIKIRGQNSLRTGGSDGNGNLPLYIVDGVPFPATTLAINGSSIIAGGTSPFNGINPSDIESIEVLKDADATAIYGSRGSNGVVLITTKKGKAGKTKVDIHYYTGVGKVPHKLDLLNTEQYLELRKEAYANDGISTYPSNAFDVNGIWDQSRYTDWQQVLIGGTSQINNAQVSLSGGNRNTQFLAGAGYYREGTVFPGNFADTKYSGHISLTHTSDNQKLQAAFLVSYVADNNNLPRTDLTSNAFGLAPNSPAIYNVNGELNWENNSWSNPMAEYLSKYSYNSDNLVSNLNISYVLLPGLKLKTQLGYSFTQLKEVSTIPQVSVSPSLRSTNRRRADFGNNTMKTWVAEPQVEYEKKLGIGKLTGLVGVTFQQTLQAGQAIRGTQFASDAQLNNLQAASVISISSFPHIQYRYNAVYGRINYNLLDKYLVNLTARRDGSSRFGPGKQFGNFGAAGIAWLFYREAMIEKALPFLSYGKLRGSYGTTGSDLLPDYKFLDTYTSTSVLYNGSSGLYPTRIATNDFSWETNKKLEVALELGFMNDRILFNASWYRNRSSNQLVQYALPFITGQSGVQANFPATVQNTGLEFELQTTNITGRQFSWKTAANISFPRSKLVSYPGIESSSYANTYAVGRPLGIRKFFIYTGVDPVTGLYTFVDLNKDGNISASNDRAFTELLGQKFYGGFQNSINYKSFQLDIFVQFVKQTGLQYAYGMSLPGTLNIVQPVELLSRWQKAGDITNIQRLTTNPSPTYSSFYRSSDRMITDASFVRLKNVSLTWQLPVAWATRMKVQSARMYVQAQNLLTFTNYIGYDPEQGIVSRLPPLRILTAGIQITL